MITNPPAHLRAETKKWFRSRPDRRSRWCPRSRPQTCSRHVDGPTARELRGKSCDPIALLAEVPIAASLGEIRPIPAQVERRRCRNSRGGDDGAQCDIGNDGPVIGLPDPRPDGPHDRSGFHGHSAAPAHCDMGPTGCDASMSNRDVPGSDGDASMSACDVTGSDDDTSMSARDMPGSDGDASMSNCDVTGSRATSA
jgi:hypothetical protein